MKQGVFLFLLTLYTASSVFAQNTYEFDLPPDELVFKEVILKGAQARDELKIMLGVKWLEVDKKLLLVFDRKKISGNNEFLLLFPSFNQKIYINDALDCKFRKKLLWAETGSAQLQFMDYFLESNNLRITDFKKCYLSLAINNEEEFSFALIDAEKEFFITLNGLFVARTEKKPFSPRDNKIEFRANPVTLLIRPEKKVEEIDLCAIREELVPYIKSAHETMKKDYEELKLAQKNQNCTLFGQVMDRIRRTLTATVDKCKEFAECEDIAAALKEYSNHCETAFKEDCRAAPTVTATCNISETELTTINTRLRNLQMSINVKKRDGVSTADENKEFQSIKASVNPRLTQECRRRHQSLIDAYTNYCRIIESLL